MRARYRAAMVALLAGVALGCASSTPSGGNGGNGGGAGDIQATADLRFEPPQLTVSQGTAVTWNFGPVAHTVVFNAVSGRPADIPNAVANQLVSRTFNTAGTFPYVCTIHPGMTGSVVVTSSSSSSPPPPPPGLPPPPPGYP